MIEQNLAVPTIDYIPNVIRSTELQKYHASSNSLQIVEGLMTPKSLLEQSEFSKPKVITPYEYPDFSTLLQEREDIRHLRLLPIKTDEEYIRYHQQSRDYLQQRVDSYLGESPMALALNVFPYFLPEDLGQYLVWIKDKSISETQVISFIAKCMERLSLKNDDLILFERSLKTTSKLVKGSFSEMRHVHFWLRLP